MHFLRKELLMALSSGVLFSFLIITGCIKQDTANLEIPIKGAVYSVHRSDGSQKTYIDVVISINSSLSKLGISRMQSGPVNVAISALNLEKLKL